MGIARRSEMRAETDFLLARGMIVPPVAGGDARGGTSADDNCVGWMSAG
jgi:hypothetical protein